MESAVEDCRRDGEEVSDVEAARELLSQLELSQGVDDDAAQIAAEDAFFNGQIRPVYPLFNRDLLLGAADFDGLDEKPPVENVFVETAEVTSSDAEALSCEWSGKAVVAAAGPDGCKKSNSTGFSKFWRFRDLLHRSNSDGRDAFVFLNNPAPSTSAAGKTEEKSSPGKKTGKAKVNGDTAGDQKKKKSKKQLSAHERYMKSKAKDEDRRRSYLPYRPELVGFFTNVKGGLTRNVHPF
nr:DNA ligase 1-like [Ipomoea batatas]